ncbi:regulator [Escherichia coli]|nr:regulator [Escherichia coli]HAW5516725.1 regulator [Escherichia coli]HDN1180887.1 regulator [Escherichia coli]
MTVIVYGKSTFAGNAKTRRHERRRKLAIERDSICNIIDSIFGTDSEEPVQEDPRKRLSLSEKAISLGSLRCKKVDEYSGSVCLPNVAIYAAGYRKSKQLTAR